MAKPKANKPPVAVKGSDERNKALASALSQIEKDFGKGSVLKLGDQSSLDIDVISTGLRPLDQALGVLGVPRGRIIEIYGPESSGKTSVALKIIAKAQANGGNAAFVDAEHALDPSYAALLGVDVDNLVVSQPDHGEQALDITEALVRSGALDVIVVDSVAALVPLVEISGQMADNGVGLQARMMSKALRKLTPLVGRTNVTVIFINQLRQNISSGYAPAGPTETTSGGRALKFFSSVRIDVRKGQRIVDKDEVIGNEVKIKVVKNKVAPPFKTCTLNLYYGVGFIDSAAIVDEALALQIVRKNGSWFSFGEEKLGQGEHKVKLMLNEPEHADLLARIQQAIDQTKEKQGEKGKKGSAISVDLPNDPLDDDVLDDLDDDLLDDLLDIDLNLPENE